MTADEATRLVLTETLGEKGLLVAARSALAIDCAIFQRIDEALTCLADQLQDQAVLDRHLVNALLVLTYEIPDYLARRKSSADLAVRDAANQTAQKVLEFVESWHGYGNW